MRQVAEYKKEIVANLKRKMQDYPVVAIVNMENLPASQLQKIRATLRNSADLFMTKKKLMRIALKETEQSKKGIIQLEAYIQGMPAILFTKDNPFKLANLLRKSKTKAPIKSGQTAPSDIVIPKGPTGFSPGPLISELNQAGLKTRIEQGKIAISETSTVVKAGETVNQAKAGVLAKLGIEPMDIGMDIMAAYEGGVVYGKAVLSIDPNEFIGNLKLAAANANALTISISYPTKDNITQLIAKAERIAKLFAGKQGEKKAELKTKLAEGERQAEALKEKMETGQEEPQEEPKTEQTAEEQEQEISIEEQPPEEVTHIEEQGQEISIEELPPEEAAIIEEGEMDFKETEEEKAEEKPAERVPTAYELAANLEKKKEKKPDFERVKTKISEDFKEEVQKEKERRERTAMEKIGKGEIEGLVQQLKAKGTLRK